MKMRGWSILAVVLCAGCVSVPVADLHTDTALEPTLEIVIGPPAIEYRGVQADVPVAVSPAERDRILGSLWTSVETVLRARGLTVRKMTEEEVAQVSLETTPGGLFEIIRAQKQGVVSAVQEARRRVRTLFPDGAVLAVRCRLYFGPSGYWDPATGAIGANSSRLLLDGRLVQLGEDRTLWREAVQLRKATDTDDGTLREMVDQLFASVHSTTQGKEPGHGDSTSR